MKIYYAKDYKPYKKYKEDAGLDLLSTENAEIYPFETRVIKTGVHIELDNNYVAIIKSRSGLALKGLIIGGGVIDCGYTGEVGVIIHNMSNHIFEVNYGDRIAQVIITPCVTDVELVEGEPLHTTSRNKSGFGSTGV